MTLSQEQFAPDAQCQKQLKPKCLCPLGGQEKVLVAHSRPHPYSHSHTLTWHMAPDQGPYTKRRNSFAPSSAGTAQAVGIVWKGWICWRTPGAHDGPARAETTTPPWSLRHFLLHEGGRWMTPFFPPAPFFLSPAVTFSPGAVWPLDQRLGKGRSVTLSPVMPGSPSGCSAQPRGSGGGRGEAVHGCLSCAAGEGERLGTDGECVWEERVQSWQDDTNRAGKWRGAAWHPSPTSLQLHVPAQHEVPQFPTFGAQHGLGGGELLGCLCPKTLLYVRGIAQRLCLVGRCGGTGVLAGRRAWCGLVPERWLLISDRGSGLLLPGRHSWGCPWGVWWVFLPEKSTARCWGGDSQAVLFGEIKH